ncbi:carboxymuconolactone decarboxylase family protein [Sinorhizobium numidicum]|uniref:Carboxymuconolactone decarboxylase family protein n=1 Tax=Sinorhizobium numidicum TaxID=680248 RepID=A0ABY8D5A3_9HYPH|nr:carboxymuconolactone decarboxylase family protein [Sinorhizobium numidicum]WEX77651.1 carboxymuconolactone decarboxylase family protein [Sinorhizobium numidicum]WEX84311.1 carboxymuconolactone decarboxylase family protein [Sinorhizobium numidicum]
MTDTKAVRYDQEIPDVLGALAEVHKKMDAHGLDRTIHHLVQLRASQINRCGFCVKMHTKEAREDGETSERLDRVVVWDQVGDFSEREKAALAWTEALTELEPRTDFAVLRSKLREHFGENEISVITSTVAMINLWNRIQISRH